MRAACAGSRGCNRSAAPRRSRRCPTAASEPTCTATSMSSRSRSLSISALVIRRPSRGACPPACGAPRRPRRVRIRSASCGSRSMNLRTGCACGRRLEDQAAAWSSTRSIAISRRPPPRRPFAEFARPLLEDPFVQELARAAPAVERGARDRQLRGQRAHVEAFAVQERRPRHLHRVLAASRGGRTGPSGSARARPTASRPPAAASSDSSPLIPPRLAAQFAVVSAPSIHCRARSSSDIARHCVYRSIAKYCLDSRHLDICLISRYGASHNTTATHRDQTEGPAMQASTRTGRGTRRACESG